MDFRGGRLQKGGLLRGRITEGVDYRGGGLLCCIRTLSHMACFFSLLIGF